MPRKIKVVDIEPKQEDNNNINDNNEIINNDKIIEPTCEIIETEEIETTEPIKETIKEEQIQETPKQKTKISNSVAC